MLLLIFYSHCIPCDCFLIVLVLIKTVPKNLVNHVEAEKCDKSQFYPKCMLVVGKKKQPKKLERPQEGSDAKKAVIISYL